MRMQSRMIIILLALSLLGILTLVYRISKTPQYNQYGILREYLEEYKSAKASRETRSILLWSSFFDNARWSLPADTLGPAQFRDELKCPVYQCELSNQHDYLPSLDMYDAIVFHTATPFPVLQPLPSRRSPHQSYVFALLEPPGETKHLLSDEQYFYNLTMTTRLDSDIVWPYAHLVDVETGFAVAPSLKPQWRQPPTSLDSWNRTEFLELWPTKTKMAAWYVSHCETLSQREKLAAALQQHFEVDIYGKCGQLRCERGDPHCDEMLDMEYKFYFAFENSLCTDYVTEKLFEALQRKIIPVVFGGANYTRFMPPHSYIDAERFESAAKLAEHLIYVASDVDEYISYFWWRQHYRLARPSPFCDLCAHMHSPTWPYRTQSYADIEGWWFHQCRMEARIRF